MLLTCLIHFACSYLFFCLCVIYFIENNISWIFPDTYFQLFDLKNIEMYLFHFDTHFLAISPHFGFYPLAVSPVYFRKDLSGNML